MPWWISAFAVALVLAMLALGGLVIVDDRRKAWSDAERTSDAVLAALDGDIADDVAIFDVSFRGLLDALALPGIDRADPAVRHMALFNRAASAEDLGTILLVDASGDVVEDSASLVPRRLNIAGRDDFLKHREHPDAGLIIERPEHGRFSPVGDEIAISRRRPSRDGSFAGIVSGQWRLDGVRRLFEAHDLGSGSEITLRHADGGILVHHPSRAAVPSLLDRTDLPPGAAAGHLVQTSADDGRRRLVTFRRIGRLPLLLTREVATEDILADWRRKAVLTGGAILSLCAAVLALLALFGREMKRRAAAERALATAAAELQQLARTDGLTGLANRRAFDAELAREWRRAIRCGDPVSLLMLDADRFKTFNDRHGHQRGDEVLQTIAACLQRSARRPGDLPARYGGEEFALILSATDEVGALAMAEMVRVSVERLDILHTDNPSGRVTVSVGAATLRPLIGAEAAVLLRMADAALYEAKRQGRNRVAGAQDWAKLAAPPEADPSVAA